MSARPRQVAAVCYRRAPEGIQFLLVRTLDNKWTFPKGQIDRGMPAVQAAELEALEEGGAIGEIESEPFASYVYTKGNSGNPAPYEIEVDAFLLAVREVRPPFESHREPQWFTPQAAKECLAQGRIEKYARELARVMDRAVEKLSAPREAV